MSLRIGVAAWWGLIACGHAPSAPDPARHVCYRGTQLLAGHFAKPGDTERFEMAIELHARAEYVVSTWSAASPGDVYREHVWLRADRVFQGTPEPASEASEWDRAWAHKLIDLSASVERVAHPTFGDVVERVQPGEAVTLDGARAPQSLSLTHATESTRWTAELERVPCPQPSAASQPRIRPRAAAQGITWSKLADGIELAILHDSQIVSLIVELPDSLVVCESGLTVQQGEQLVDALVQRFPRKPVAHVFFGHHHPFYTGGLRAFIAAGALVHAPAHSAQFVEQLAALPFQLTPDRLARRNVPPRIEPFTGNIELRDDRGAVIEAIDIGKESNHTDEYVVFYLPRHKLLFQGDLE
jgi:hypothetical protein